jgi:hypothetical protein
MSKRGEGIKYFFIIRQKIFVQDTISHGKNQFRDE